MKKINKTLALVVALSLTALVGVQASAQNENNRPATIPASATEIAPGVFDLGKAVDPKTGKTVDGLAIVHYKNPKAKGGNNAKPPRGASACYGFISKGAKWKSAPEPWVFNAANLDNLNSTDLFNILDNGITKWETAAQNTSVLGAGALTTATLAAGDDINGNNEVEFADLGSTGTIAVTTVWGYFSGPTFAREIVEWDMEFNTGFGWATDGNLSKMDFDNIATHELGHAFGLADLYTSSCEQETMYGYADFGEIIKRDLGSGDIAGINVLY